MSAGSAAPSTGSPCSATCGISRERDRDRVAARALAERAYPNGASSALWTPDAPAFASDEARALCAAMAAALPCDARVKSDVRCDWIYLVATVDSRTWLALREGQDLRSAGGVEQGIRVGLSSLGRFATLQEIHWSGTVSTDGIWVEETRCAGVDDRRLVVFVKAAQGILRRQRIPTLDAAFLADPVTDPTVTLWNALFDPDPMTTSVGTWIPTELHGAGVSTE